MSILDRSRCWCWMYVCVCVFFPVCCLLFSTVPFSLICVQSNRSHTGTTTGAVGVDVSTPTRRGDQTKPPTGQQRRRRKRGASE